MRRMTVVVLASLVASGCESPEATRTRGGGPGADPLNHAQPIEMHGGSRQYWETPIRIEGIDAPSLEPARQAQQLTEQQ